MNRYDQRVRELRGEVMLSATHQPGIHPSEAQLADVEERLGATLPEDYREFLRDYGCYFFYRVYFPVKPNLDGVTRGALAVAYGVVHKVVRDEPDYIYDIVRRYGYKCQYPGEWPLEWLPIGDSGAPMTIALAIKGEHKGAVHYYFNHGSDSGQHSYPVADSFDEFMGLLEIDPEALAELEEIEAEELGED